jgi:hypothetical protein
MSNMLSNLEHGIASAWGSLEKEFSALKQMDSINPKYLAHGKVCVCVCVCVLHLLPASAHAPDRPS